MNYVPSQAAVAMAAAVCYQPTNIVAGAGAGENWQRRLRSQSEFLVR